MKNNKFEFYPAHEFFEPLSEAKNFIPEWYKKIPPFTAPKAQIANYKSNVTLKQCIPFLDSLTNGFMITTQMDIQVTIMGDGEPSLTWMNSPDPLILRDINANKMPNPKGTHNTHFAWILPCYLKTPKGYSMFFTHPLNRFDLPFFTLSGIIDGDKGITNGIAPFFLHKDFEGIIPKGTPIAQIIPFKKENWVARKEIKIKELGDKENFKARSVVRGYYKANVWIKSMFEVKNGEEPTCSQHQHHKLQ
jgi:hypothetical protein